MFYVNLDVSGLVSLMDTPRAAKAVLRKAGEKLTQQTREHIVEQANRRLKTRRQMYIDGLSAFQENAHTWVISLDAKVRWIDDGLQPHNMLDDLLKSKKAKIGKNGGKYIAIPFQHKKGPTQMTPAQSTLTATLKLEMAKFGVPYGKIEKHPNGQPRMGVLHEFDITHVPLKSHNGAGQGWGPIGDVRQGPTGIPFLQGVQVRQRMAIDKKGKEFVAREIMTFRIASDSQRDQPGRWDHPGTAPVPLIEEGAKWAKEHWETQVAPQIMNMIKAELH
jgi:hypothetical protein